MWRQGDVLIQAIESIPRAAVPRESRVLAEGAVTGHTHELHEVEGARLFEKDGTLYLEITRDYAAIVHPEHATIDLKRGLYRIWRQREYSGVHEPPRFVMD